MMGRQALRRDEWLLRNGFAQDGQAQNPFTRQAQRAEADPRREECFEAFPYYEAVKGTLQSPGPTFIYAARGGGKSALCYHILSDMNLSLKKTSGRVLAVVYDQFDRALTLVDNDPTRIRLRTHIEHIIGLIAVRLFNLSVGKPPRVDLGKLTKSQKQLLLWYIVHFAKELHYEEVNQWLGRLLGFRYYLNPKNSVKVLLSILSLLPKSEDVVEAASEVLTSWPMREANPAHITGRKLLGDLVETCQALGLDGVYVLVDNLDSANLLRDRNDFEAAFHFIRPLCTTPALAIHDIPGLVFKIFIPEEVYPLTQQAFRPDLGERHIRWQELLPDQTSPLKRVLRKRLEVYSNGTYSSLSPLVEKELAARIDRLFVEQAMTPRELWVLGCGMLEAHFAYESDEPLLTAEDWRAARRELDQYRQCSNGIPAPSFA